MLGGMAHIPVGQGIDNMGKEDILELLMITLIITMACVSVTFLIIAISGVMEPKAPVKHNINMATALEALCDTGIDVGMFIYKDGRGEYAVGYAVRMTDYEYQKYCTDNDGIE